MFCRRCGHQVSENMSFCQHCGTAVSPEAQPVSTPVVNGPIQYVNQTAGIDTRRQPKNKHTLRTVLIIAGCVLAVCGALVPVLINADLSSRYNQASEMLDSGDAQEAKAMFLKLGSYKDSEDMVQACDYFSAEQMMDDGSYEEAITAFAALGSYEDADEQAKKCQDTLDYNNAITLKDSGETEQARDIFLSLESFEDAAAQAQECQNMLDYDKAAGLMNQGAYEEAKGLYDALTEYKDAAQLSLDCQNNIDYAAADAKFNDGNYYEAYKMFTLVNGFKDAADRIADCIQQKPQSGELYRNPDYAKKTCAVNIKLGGLLNSLYVKVYTEDDVLVSTVFLNPGEKTKIKLPTGTYRFKAAYGTDWFGEKDMFGDYGYYEKLIFDDGKDTWSLTSKYIYTLSMMQEEEGNMGSTEIGPEGF